MDIRQLNFDKYRPSEYMRARRPELFSDTSIIEELRLKQEVFEYHLETLTSRKQEYEFECFCRRLAEKELCPNLLPQTGPTGGGDSKTDAETYPVADTIALRWYEGVGREASQERWGFAFSAKKKWKSKVCGDVEKIVKTKRGYSLIYFISNQFIKDKDRASLEDELKDKYHIPVRILDRTWIVKCVFEHNRQQLAIETLGLTQYEKINRRSIGPRDTQRESELKKLETDIQDCNRYKGVEYQLAEDCMKAALLARGLGYPRIEVEGRFERAEKIAEKVNYRQQRMHIAYIRTWTAFFWYDDADELNKSYDRVEEFAIGSEQSEDIEKLVNLWMLLTMGVNLRQLDATQAKLEKRKRTLKSELNRLAADNKRPNNALLAKIHCLLLSLYEAVTKKSQIDNILDELAKILESSQNSFVIPFESISEIIQELGKLLPENKKLDQVFESIVNLTENRTSKGAAGCLLLEHGYQRLQNGKKYEAIRLFARAQEKLVMDEYREEFVGSLVGGAIAYESAGLLWAARRNMLAAANQTLEVFWKHGEVMPRTLYYLQKLVWLELQLGRIPYVLSWMDTALCIANSLILNESEKKHFTEERQIQDIVLGLLFLKTDLSKLKWLDFMPSVLERMGLAHSWMALIFALGHVEYLRKEKVIPADQSEEDVLTFFIKWLTQPASRDVPEKPELLEGTKVTLSTFVIGCHIIVETANNFDSLCLSEKILAVLEAFLATGLDESIFPYRSELQITIRPSEFITGLPKYQKTEENGVLKIEIQHAPNLTQKTIELREEYHEWLREVMIFIFCQIAVMDNPEETLKKMANEGAAFTRALGIVETEVCIKNILGENPKYSIWGWKSQTNEKMFPLTRDVTWYEGHGYPIQHNEPIMQSSNIGEKEGIESFSGIDNLKHSDIRVLSVINMPLWNKAEWKAMAYIWENKPPFFILGFMNLDAGKAIFKEWQNRFGIIDKEEYIRVSIIKGIDKLHPYSYNVVIGVNPEFAKRYNQSRFFMISRIHRMEPSTPQNLQGFLTQYEKAKSYIIMPALYKDPPLWPEVFPRLGILKRELRVCEAWQIDEHDPDICALSSDTNPIIPKNIKNPPIFRAIEYLNKLRKLKEREK